jgi:hypothetical protein
MKKLIVCLAILAMSSNVFAAEKLIGSWENLTNEGWIDHEAMASHSWSNIYVDDSLVMPSIYTWGDIGTDGYSSLVTNVTGWGWKMRTYINADFATYSKIEFDIYAVAQEGSAATWAQVQQMAFSGATNSWWSPTGSGFNIGLGGSWTHCVLDYSAYHTTSYFNTGDYMSVIFA